MMLHFIRERAKGWFAWIIVILISIPFALWGVNSYITPDPDPAIATIADAKVGSYEFQNAVQREQQNLQTPMSDEQLRKLVLDRLINNRALLNMLNESGYVISKAQIDQRILSEQSFKDPETGQFSEKLFSQVVRSMGLSFESYRIRLAQDMMIEQYLAGISQSAIITDLEVDQAMKLIKQKRDISYVEISADKFKEGIELSADKIEEYYQANQEAFAVPETVQLDYILVSRDEIAKEMQVADDEVQKYYDENALSYGTPEERQASHILISFKADDSDDVKAEAKAKIDDIYQKIQAGGDFAELAKEFSQDPGSGRNGGDLGFFPKGAMVPEFEEQAFSLEVDKVSEPFESPFGYHILKVTGIKPVEQKPLSEVKDDIVSRLQFDMAEKPYFEQVESLETIAYEQPDSLEPAANASGAKLQKSEFISREGGKGIFANPKLIAKVFDIAVLEEGNNSELIDLGGDKSIVARVSERIPASIKPLHEVEEEIKTRLREELAKDKALELANSLATAFNESGDIAAQLKENGLEIQEKGLIERSNPIVPESIIQKAFSMPRIGDKAVAASLSMGASQAGLVMVSAIEEGKTDDEQLKQTVRAVLERSRGQLMANLGILQIRKSADVEINQERLNGEQ